MYAQVEKTKENKSRSVANSVAQKKDKTKQGFGFVDNRPEAVAQRKNLALMNNHAASQPIQKKGPSVKSKATIKHRPDEDTSEKTEVGEKLNIGGPYGEENIKAHPQTKKLLNGYTQIGTEKFACAEPHALSDAVSGVSKSNEITKIEVASTLNKDLPMKYRIKEAWKSGGYYDGITTKGEKIRRCPTCVTLLGDYDKYVRDVYK